MTQTIYFDPETPERLQPFHTALAFSHTSIQFQEAGEKKVVFMLGAGVSTAWLPVCSSSSILRFVAHSVV